MVPSASLITRVVATAGLAAVLALALLAMPPRADATTSAQQPVRADDSDCQGGPAGVLDLRDWKITLPLAKPDDDHSPLEIKQPDLARYTKSPWFTTAAGCDAVLFRAPVNGVTTTGSRNPRSELREMSDGGSENADWSATAGTHVMTVREAFTHLPEGKPELVGAQIHDADDDITVFRLEGSNLWVTRGDDPHYKLVTDSYELGTPFEARFEVSDGKVVASYDGRPVATIEEHFHGAYFKAGAYTQANCDNAAPCSKDNYGETEIYQLSVSHQVTTWDLIRDWLLTTGPLVLAALILIAVALLAARRLRARRTSRP